MKIQNKNFLRSRIAEHNMGIGLGWDFHMPNEEFSSSFFQERLPLFILIFVNCTVHTYPGDNMVAPRALGVGQIIS